MNTSKRAHSPAESERCTKTAKLSHESDTAVAAENPEHQHSDKVQVTIKLRSTSKAARHDPKPLDYWDTAWTSKSSGRDVNDRPSPSPGESRAPSSPAGAHFPTPVQPSSSSATGRPEPPAPIDGLPAHGDGPIAGDAEAGDAKAGDVEDKERDSDSDSSLAQTDETADGGEVVDYTLGDEELAYLRAAVGDTFGHTLGDEELLYDDMYEDFSDSGLSRNDEFAHWRWLEQIDGDASVGGNLVAVCDAKLIRRAHIRRTFWSEMAEPSEETSDLGFELFDRYGRLSREHYDHGIGKGSGAWGEELNHGDMLLFETLHVERSRRHQGIGTKIVNAILDKVRAKSDYFFAFVRPGYLTRDVEVEEDGKQYSEVAKELSTISLHFWRSLGFRRVGTSSWLAFTDNDRHPSWRLSVGEDWDIPKQSKEEEPLPETIQTVFNALSDPSASDAECVRQIQEAFPGDDDAAPRSYTDKAGNTILHVAAVGKKVEAIACIRAKYPFLTGRNAWGHTPLEALQSSLEKHRTRRRAGMPISVALDRFEGFSQPEIASLAALTGTEIIDLTKLSDQDISAVSSAADDAVSRFPKINTIRHTLRLKYGCTCGECIGGFLSPRMHFALLCQAEHRHDLLTADLDAKGPAWVASHGLELDHLALPVRENLNTNKSMRQGFTRMCGHIARCLRERRVPDEEAVLASFRNQRSEWPPVTKHYLQRGGTVAAVATMLFDKAMHWDEWAGDGIHLDAHGGHVKALPVCRNDHEFGFVSGMCGYKRVSVIQYVDIFGRERVY